VNGVRCRILIETRNVQETDAVLAAFQIRNAGAAPITLEGAGSPPFSAAAAVWRMDAMEMMVGGGLAAKATTSKLQLAPNETFTTAPAKVLVPPGTGVRRVSAVMSVSGRELAARPLEISVVEAAWGAATDGLSLRVAASRQAYEVGRQPKLHLFVRNLTRAAVILRGADWASAEVESRQDLVIIRCRADDNAFGTVPGENVWVRPVETPLLLAPGKYRVRLVIESPELPATSRRAWHGTLVSNDCSLEIVPAGEAVR